MVDLLYQDVAYATRVLRRNPGFTVLCLVILSVTIGASTAAFGLINALLYEQPGGLVDPARLVWLGRTDDKKQGFDTFSAPNFRDYERRTSVFTGLAAFSTGPMSISARGNAARIKGSYVSGNYFGVVGVRAAIGRTLSPADDTVPGERSVAVLSHSYWRQHLAGDASIIGAQIHVNGTPLSVVGIAEPQFRGTRVGEDASVWVPITMQPILDRGFRSGWLTSRRASWLSVFGRLRPGVTVAQAQAEVDSIAHGLAEVFPENASQGVRVVDRSQWGQLNFGKNALRYGWLLLWTASLLLAIGCANLASLFLARASTRTREVSLRLALGASQRRVFLQLITESTVVGLAGGVAGLSLASWISDLLVPFVTASTFPPMTVDFHLDLRVAAFAFIVSASSGIVFGLVPAIRMSQTDLIASLKDAGGCRQRVRTQQSLVVLQLGLSVVLVVVSALFLLTLKHVSSIEPGFATEKALLLSVDFEQAGYTRDRAQQYQERALEVLRLMPGITDAGLWAVRPLTGRRSGTTAAISDSAPFSVGYNIVSPGFTKAFGIGLIMGRDFTKHDRQANAQVAIVNESLARTFPHHLLLGRRIRLNFTDEEVSRAYWEVIGIIRDTKYRGLTESPEPRVYLCHLQRYAPQVTFHVRTAGSAESMLPAVKRELSTLDDKLPVYDAVTMRQQLRSSYSQQRMGAILVSVLAAVSVALAILGLYGIVSYTAARYSKEVGIRLALGASRASIMRLFVGRGLALTLAGLTIGLAGASVARTVVVSFVWGVSPHSAGVLFIVSFGLGVVALMAALVPAWRAANLDANRLIRYE